MWLEFQKWQLLTNIHVDESASSDTGNRQYWAIFMLTKVLRATQMLGNIRVEKSDSSDINVEYFSCSKMCFERRKYWAFFMFKNVLRATQMLAILRVQKVILANAEQDFFFCLWWSFLETALLVFKIVLFKMQMFRNIRVQTCAFKTQMFGNIRDQRSASSDGPDNGVFMCP